MNHSRLNQSVSICLIFTVSFLFGCDFVYEKLDKEGAEEKELIGDIVPPEKNPAVEEIQALLNLYGYAPGSVDGVIGLRTRESIAKFQEDRGLTVTRQVDRSTWELLSRFERNELVVGGRINVALVQTLLNKSGFSPGPVDGKLGKKTTAAVMAFQKAHNIKVDGKIGYQTLDKLSEYLSVPAAP